MPKKEEKSQPSSLKIVNRTPGKIKQNYFGDFKQRVAEKHPIDEMFPEGTENIDVRDNKTETSEVNNLGHPSILNSDINNQNIRTPETNILGHPSNNNSDAQINQTRTSEPKNLGHKLDEISDTKTPVIEFRTSEKLNNSDTKTPSKKISDTRENEKTDRKAYDSNYEAKRKNNSSIDRMNLRPAADIGKRIRVFCAEQGFDLTEFFQLAAIRFIDNFKHPSFQNSDTKTSHDNRRLMTFSKTNALLINLYFAYNTFFNPQTKWTVRDDEAAFKYNDADIRLIELAIIQTHFNRNFKSGKINSFNYYVTEIDILLEGLEERGLKDENIEAKLQLSREVWSKFAKTTLDLSFLKKQDKK